MYVLPRTSGVLFFRFSYLQQEKRTFEIMTVFTFGGLILLSVYRKTLSTSSGCIFAHVEIKRSKLDQKKCPDLLFFEPMLFFLHKTKSRLGTL